MEMANSSSIGGLTEHLNTKSVGYTFLTVYQVITTLLALLGNFTLLFLSYRYNAVPVDCVSLVLVEVLAMLHILLALTSLLSASVTLIAQRWVLSSTWCGVQGFVSYTCVLTQLYTVLLVSCHRAGTRRHARELWRAYNLRRAVHVQRQVGVILVAVMVGVLFAAVQENSFYFSPGLLSCKLSDNLVSNTALMLLIAGLILPSLLLTLTLNLRILMRSNTLRGLNVRQRDNTHTMCAVSLLFVICCLPATTVGMYKVVNSVPAWLETLTFELFHITTFANPLLYLTLNGGFRHVIANGIPAVKSPRQVSSHSMHHSLNSQSSANVLRPVPTR